MNQPADVFLNSKGDIYVTDALNNAVHCFDSAGGHQHSFGEKSEMDGSGGYPDGSFLFPFTLFIDKNDEVYVSDVKRNDIQVFAPDGEFLRKIQVDTGEGAETLRPNGLHVLDDGRLVMTDSGNHRFLITSAAGEIQTAVGGRGDEPGQFNFPDELIVTASGEIWIVDVINCRVQIFDLDGKFLRTFGEVGQGAGTFGRPKGIAIDEQRGRVWISESMGNLLQGFTKEGEIKSILGGADDEWSFASPRGLFLREGRFYVVNRLHNEVLVFSIG
jgi:tripartite motif-containing protein 71